MKNGLIATIAIIAVLLIGSLIFYFKYPEARLNSNSDYISTDDSTGFNPSTSNSSSTSNIPTSSVPNNSGSYASVCGMTVMSQKIGEKVTIPFTVFGTIDNTRSKQIGCSWSMFEGESGTAELLVQVGGDWKRISKITIVPVKNWMSAGSSFSVDLEKDNSLITPQISKALIAGAPLRVHFYEEDPAGSGRSDQLNLDLVYGGESETVKVTFFTYDNQDNMDCGATRKMVQYAPKTTGVADASLKALFKNESLDRDSLIDSYNSVSIKNGIATVDFDNSALKYLDSAACMQASYKAPIEKTLKQFSNIKEVQYSIEGKIKNDWDA